MLRYIALLLRGLRQRLEEEVAAPVVTALAQHAVAEEVDVAIDDTRTIGPVQQVTGFDRRCGPGDRGDCVDGCGVSHETPPRSGVVMRGLSVQPVCQMDRNSLTPTCVAHPRWQ